MNLETVTFPILTISQGVVVAVETMDLFTTASPRAVEIGYFSDMWLVDSTARAFHVTGCQVAKEFFWRRPKTPFGRGVRLNGFDVKELGRSSSADIKSRVLGAIAADSETWAAAGDVGDLVKRIEACQIAAEIINVVVAR